MCNDGGNGAMELVIRPVTRDDAEAIVGILNPIIEAGGYTVLDTPLSVEAERRYIRAFSRRGVFLVAERGQEGKVVGFQSMEPFASYTRAFDHVAVVGTFVELSLRRHGIGTRLSEVGFEAARRLGYEKVFSYVRADNLDSLAFHLHLGYRIVGTLEKHARIAGSYIDEIVIEKLLL